MFWFVFLIPAVAIICVFTFVSIDTWSKNRLKEREEYYKNETYQKMLDGSSESVEAVRQMIREEERREELQQRRSQKQGLLMGGVITAVVGLGVGIFLYSLVPDEPVFLVGLIPLLIGLVLTVFGVLMSAPEARSS